ncbi:MAG: adenylate/guanylate cyclase domain-containing protein [Spongiibacteraceae bacterium]
MGLGRRRSGSELVERILAEVQLTAAVWPVSAREHLRKRLELLLTDAGYPSAKAEWRQVTILIADIRGFTSLVERHPADVVVSMLNRYLALMIEIALRHGGAIDKLMGDAVMVVFGAPEPQPEHVQNALACAVEMQQAMSQFNQQNETLQLPPLYVGIGISSGEVIAGPIGSPLHREYTVIGSEVNLAARIEAQSLRGQVLIGESTYRSAREHILIGAPTRVMAKGKSLAVTLYELLGTTKPRLMAVPRREIRKSPRVLIQMPCYFQQLRDKTVLPPLHCGQVVDMGYHGLRMLSPVVLDAYGEIKMAISLQLLGARTSDVYSRVVATDTDADGFNCSMEFTDIDMAAQQAIKYFVDSQIVTPPFAIELR